MSFRPPIGVRLKSPVLTRRDLQHSGSGLALNWPMCRDRHPGILPYYFLIFLIISLFPRCGCAVYLFCSPCVGLQVKGRHLFISISRRLVAGTRKSRQVPLGKPCKLGKSDMTPKWAGPYGLGPGHSKFLFNIDRTCTMHSRSWIYWSLQLSTRNTSSKNIVTP